MYQKIWVMLDGKNVVCVYKDGLYRGEIAYFIDEDDAELFIKALDLANHYYEH